MKHVLVTGGAGGIGSEIVKALLEKDCFVHIFDIDESESSRLLEETGENVAVYNVDVTDISALKNAAKQLEKTVKFDHIITCAGRALKGEWIGFAASSSETNEKSIALNLTAHIQTVHTFLPLMKKEGNRSILFISSINALSDFGLPVYSAAKAGLTGFVNSAVGEMGKKGIRINSLLPGTVITEGTKAEPKDFKKLLSTTAINRFVTAKEVGSLAAAIVCDFVGLTGQNIVLDAGQSKTHK